MILEFLQKRLKILQLILQSWEEGLKLLHPLYLEEFLPDGRTQEDLEQLDKI